MKKNDLLFTSGYRNFYPLSSKQFAEKGVERPSPFVGQEIPDPCSDRRINTLYDKLSRAKFRFYFAEGISEEKKQEYWDHCEKSVREFFEHLRQEGRMPEFERVLAKFTSGNGGYGGIPTKRVIISPPGELGCPVLNHESNFFWDGDAQSLFDTLKNLIDANLPASGDIKHLPVLPVPGQELATFQAQIERYKTRYDREDCIDAAQITNLETALNMSAEEARIPKTGHGIWYKLEKDVPDNAFANVADIIGRGNLEEYCIHTKPGDIEAAESALSEFKKKNPELAEACENIKIIPTKSLYFNEDLPEELRAQLEKAIETELSPKKGTGNAPAAADLFRVCLPFLGGGVYLDFDTEMPKTLPNKLYAPLGFQLAVIPRQGLAEPNDTNQFFAANTSPLAKQLAIKALEKMMLAYKKKPNLSKLQRDVLSKAVTNPDHLALESLKKRSTPGVVQLKCFLRRTSFDRYLMRKKSSDPFVKRTLTLLIGNQLCQAAKEMYGKYALNQLPDALCFLGRLWQTGHINSLVEYKWTKAEPNRITPLKNLGGKSNRSVTSLASYDEDNPNPREPQISFPVQAMGRVGRI